MSVATELEPRLAARGRARRRTRLATTLTVFALLVLVGVGTWLLLGTSVLGVRSVTVTGTDRLDPATVREVAAVPAGEPLATLDTGAVAADVRQVRAASPDDVRLQLTKGRTVVWGSAERSARKAAVLAVLLTRRASVYDVTAPDAPTTTK